VGERSYDEVADLSKPIADALAGEASRLLTDGTKEDLFSCETAVCIRPALPSGQPLIHAIEGYGPYHRVILCVGHAAGGFTESPAVADMVLEQADI
jgi:glycine/D-amino acid oxidase-like deaminating enzyme